MSWKKRHGQHHYQILVLCFVLNYCHNTSTFSICEQHFGRPCCKLRLAEHDFMKILRFENQKPRLIINSSQKHILICHVHKAAKTNETVTIPQITSNLWTVQAKTWVPSSELTYLSKRSIKLPASIVGICDKFKGTWEPLVYLSFIVCLDAYIGCIFRTDNKFNHLKPSLWQF